MIGTYAAYILWWGMSIFAFASMVMLLIDAITFLGGRPDRTVTNTFQRFFGGSKESWRAAMFGFIVGTVLTHLTGWGAIPPILP